MVSIIIVNWNGKKWLAGCLEAVFNQSYRDIEVIVVDNNSSDDSLDFIRANYPQIKVVENSSNLGFGRANNIGVKKSAGNTLFFLNNDTLMEGNLIEDLLQEKLAKSANIVGPKILDYEKNDIYQSRKISIDCTGYLGWGKRTFFVEGCALMIDKTDFLKLGGFDEKYFMYSEDIDLCWRAWLCGMKVEICDSVSLIHFGGGSSEATMLTKGKRHVVPIFRRYEVEKNNLRNLLKNYSWFNLIWTVPMFLCQSFFEAAVYAVTGNFKASGAIWKAIWWNILNIGDTMDKRQAVQSGRKISDLHIFSRVNLRPNKIQALLASGLPKFK